MLELTFAVTPRSDNADFFLALEGSQKNARDKLFDDVLTTLSRFFVEITHLHKQWRKNGFQIGCLIAPSPQLNRSA